MREIELYKCKCGYETLNPTLLGNIFDNAELLNK